MIHRHINRRISIIFRNAQAALSKELSPYGIGPSHFRIMRRIDKNPGIIQSELGEFYQMDKAAIFRSIKLLEEKGYVVREKDDKDRRAWRLNLTDTARELLPVMHTAHHKIENILIGHMDEDEKNSLLDHLDEMCERIKEYRNRKERETL